MTDFSGLEDALGSVYDSLAGEQPVDAANEEENPPAQGAAEASDGANNEVKEQPDQENAPEEEESPADAQPALQAPERWSAEDKATFAQLPKDAQELVLKREDAREAAFTQKTQELASLRREFGEAGDLLQPFKQKWVQQGVPLTQALGDLLSAERFAEENPREFLQNFAKHHNISVELPEDGFADPEIKQLQERIKVLETREQGNAGRTEAAIQQDAQRATQDFFANGEKYPHATRVANDVVMLIPGIQQQNPSLSPREHLDMAYHKAIRLHDDLTPTNTQRVADEQALLKAKKAGAATPAKSHHTTPVKREPKDIDEAISFTVDELFS